MIKLELSAEESKNLTKDEVEITKARKLEFLILPHLRRNLKFFYAGADIPNKAKAYNQSISEKELTDAMSGKSPSLSVVCKPLCFMVAEILRDNGLNAEPVSCDTDIFRHTDVLLTTSSGKKYIINYLEDMENVQTGMKTPDFASEEYYNRRYKKFEGVLTTDGKDLTGISFLSEEELGKIDENLGYKKQDMYMDEVIKAIRNEFIRYRSISAKNAFLNELGELKINGFVSKEQEKKIKYKYKHQWQKMKPDVALEQKLDWLFEYFNDRMDITGYTDFVMYHSRLLLKKVLLKSEYEKLTRYEGFVQRSNIPEDFILKDILDYDNPESKSKLRFCVLKLNDKAYVYSTKPNVYKKLIQAEYEQLEKNAVLSKVERPSELVIKLADKGSGLPIVFHPLGSAMLNERANMIDKNLSEEARKKEIEKLADSIIATDGEITSLTIPYPDGKKKYIYFNENNEYVVKSGNRRTIYHYDSDKDNFTKEIISGQDR